MQRARVDILRWRAHSGQVRLQPAACGQTGRIASEVFLTDTFPQGTVHTASEDLKVALLADPEVFSLWERLTPLGRNEFICWVEDAKQAATRLRRIQRTREELLEGKKRPCCWAGCIHRTDKPPSRWQQAVLIDGKRKKSA